MQDLNIIQNGKPMKKGFRYDINLLRVIALVGVVLFHFNPSWMPGGYLGVDVFFVISGFLMSSIIIKGLDSKNFNIFGFYLSRANRIIPPLVFLCLTLLVFGWFFIPPLEYKKLSNHIFNSLIFDSNISYWLESGYFDVSSYKKWLLHTWSLSVEWQFYIIYPVILLLLNTIFSLDKIKKIIVLFVVFGFLFNVYNTFKHPSAAFYFINSRAWEMGVGTLIFFYPRVFSGRVQSLIFLVGLALIIISYIYPEYSLYSLVPVLGALLILFANKDFYFLNKGPLFYLGRWSYSIYLWHWPICVFGYFYVIENWFYIGVPLSIFLGFISFNFIECSQFNKSPLKNGYTYLFLLVLFSSKYIDSNLGGQNFWVERQDEITKKTYQILVESDPHTGSWGADTDGNQDFSECRFNVDTKINEQFIDRINSCHKKFGEGVLILGDSHAKDLFGMVSSRFDNEFLIGVTSTHGCRPHTPKAQCPYNKILDLVSKEKYFSHIIFEQAGFYLMKDGEHEGNRTMFSKLPIDKEVEDITLNKPFVDKDIDYLNQLAKYTNVTWFGVRFEPHITDVIILKNKCNFPYHFRPGQKEIFSSLEEFIKQSLTSSNVEYLSQNDILSYEFPDDFMNCQNTFWDDGDHLSAYGEEELGKRLPENFLESQR